MSSNIMDAQLVAPTCRLTASDNRYARLANTNNFTATQNIKVAASQFAISIEETNSSVDTIRLYGNGEIECKQITQTAVNSSSAFAGALNLNGALTTLATSHFVRTSGTTNDWIIQGRTTSQPSTNDGLLLYVSRDPASSGSDAISYKGLTSGGDNIQTKASVQTLLNAAIGSTYTTVNNSQNTPSSDTDMIGNNWYVKAKLCQGGTAVSIIINAGKSGSLFGTNTKICKLPSSFCGTRDVCIPVVSKMNDNPITQGFVYLDVATRQLTIGQTVPASSVSAEWEGAMVYGID